MEVGAIIAIIVAALALVAVIASVIVVEVRAWKKDSNKMKP